MLTALIFTIFLIIPLIFCIYRSKLKYFLYFSIAFYWLPISLPIGSYLSGISISDVFLYSSIALYLVSKKNPQKKEDIKFPLYLKIGLSLFVLGSILSSTHSVDNRYLSLGFRHTVLLPVLLLFITSRVLKKETDIKIIVNIFLISTIILLFVLVLYPETEEFIAYRAPSLTETPARLGGEYKLFNKYDMYFYESTVGTFLGFVIPFFLSFYLFSKKREKRKFLYAVIILFIFLVLSGGRSGWIACIIGSCLVFFLYIKSTRKLFNFVKFFIPAVIAIFFVKYVFSPLLGLEKFLLLRFLSFNEFFFVPTMQQRMYLWQLGLDIFSKNIWGIGFWNLEELTGFGGNSTWVNLLLDVGAIGTFGFMLIFLFSYKETIKNYFNSKREIKIISTGILGSMTAFIISGTTENLLQSSYYCGFSFWLFISITQYLRININSINKKKLRY